MAVVVAATRLACARISNSTAAAALRLASVADAAGGRRRHPHVRLHGLGGHSGRTARAARAGAGGVGCGDAHVRPARVVVHAVDVVTVVAAGEVDLLGAVARRCLLGRLGGRRLVDHVLALDVGKVAVAERLELVALARCCVHCCAAASAGDTNDATRTRLLAHQVSVVVDMLLLL